MLFKRNFLDRFGTAALIFSNEHLNDIMKIIKSLEESGLSIKDVAETIINKVKKNGVNGAGKGTGEGTIRAGQDFKCRVII